MRCSTLPVLGLLLSVSVQAGATGTAPNVVFIYVDDMRNDFLSSAGHSYIQTPNLDRLASEGVRYTNTYVTTPLCGPSRAALMTGLLPSENHIYNHDSLPGLIANGQDLPSGEMIYDRIDAAGVTQGVFGKWHFGAATPLQPIAAYDDWFIQMGTPPINGVNNVGTYNQQAHFNRYYNDNGTRVTIEQYNTDLMFDQLGEFIAAQSSATEPYYAFTSLFSPHAPFDPAPRHLNDYAGNGIPNRPNLDLSGLSTAERDQVVADYERQAEMMLAIDEGVGELLAQLEAAGTLDDTVIIFSSDNGFNWGEHGDLYKRQPWQESINVPLLVRWGNGLTGGQVDDSPVSHTDISMTIADLLGAELPSGVYAQSMADQWWAGQTGSNRDDVVSIQYPSSGQGDFDTPMWATIITDDGWKYVAVPDADTLDLTQFGRFLNDLEPMLFDLNADPYELNNLAGQAAYSAIEDQLKARLAAVLAENSAETAWIGAPVPEPGTGAVCLLSLALVSMRRRRSA